MQKKQKNLFQLRCHGCILCSLDRHIIIIFFLVKCENKIRIKKAERLSNKLCYVWFFCYLLLFLFHSCCCFSRELICMESCIGVIFDLLLSTIVRIHIHNRSFNISTYAYFINLFSVTPYNSDTDRRSLVQQNKWQQILPFLSANVYKFYQNVYSNWHHTYNWMKWYLVARANLALVSQVW